MIKAGDTVVCMKDANNPGDRLVRGWRYTVKLVDANILMLGEIPGVYWHKAGFIKVDKSTPSVAKETKQTAQDNEIEALKAEVNRLKAVIRTLVDVA